MKQLYLTLVWLLLSGGIIITSIATLQFIELQPIAASDLSPKGEPKITTGFLQRVTSDPDFTTAIEGADARAQIVANFLKRHNSPMEPHEYYGTKIVEIADRHGIDFRLLPAIAMQESNLCKVIPEGSYNCLGFGVHARGTLAFESYEANFERAARELKRNYIEIGLTSPEQIQRKYTPSSNGSWAASVNQWMAEMRFDDRQLGRELKTNADVLEFVLE
jgi:hypothetical protein